MSRVIFKYVLAHHGNLATQMPKGAKVLHVGVQYQNLCLWALVDIEQPVERRWFSVYGTGEALGKQSNSQNYIGTAEMMVGMTSTIWHVFEDDEP
jgi:hypothetical protein